MVATARTVSLWLAMAGCLLAAVALWVWRARRGARRPAGRPPTEMPPLALPEARHSALPLSQMLELYARRPGRFLHASSVRLLVDGREAYPEMLAAIEKAAASVELETYILRADGTGGRFRDALCGAARRGVRVRVLYDYIGSLGLPDRFVRALTDAGVQVAVYRPLVLARPIWPMTRRDHRKILVVDQQVTFTGGLNIADDEAPAEDGGGGWRDTHVRIEGAEVAQEGARLFETAWRQADVYGERGRRVARLKAELSAQVRKLAGIRRAWLRRVRVAEAPHEVQGVPVHLISNDEFRYRWGIRRAYLYAIEHARDYILIENAYFIPARSVRRALARAIKRGVTVAVAVPRFSDVPIVAYASRHLYAGQLKRGVRIFEWPEGMLHAKTAVIDDAWAIVGSYNFDHRSLFQQLEVVAVVVDPEFARRLRGQTLADLGRCHEVTHREHAARSFVRRALESAAYRLRDWL